MFRVGPNHIFRVGSIDFPTRLLGLAIQFSTRLLGLVSTRLLGLLSRYLGETSPFELRDSIHSSIVACARIRDQSVLMICHLGETRLRPISCGGPRNRAPASRFSPQRWSEIKMGHGGKRTGAGRKRKITNPLERWSVGELCSSKWIEEAERQEDKRIEERPRQHPDRAVY